MSPLPFLSSIRAKLLLIALFLLLIPVIGFRFVQQMDGYLREGQQQVLVNSARLLAATLSNRPQLFPSDFPADSATADELERRRLLGMFSGADPEAAANLGGAYLPSEGVERILSVFAGDAARIWVVDARSRVRGLAGNLKPYAASPAGAAVNASFYSKAIRPVIRWLASEGDLSANEETGIAQRLVMAQVDRALVGEPNVRTRPLGPGGTPVVSVAQPVWQGDSIVAAVVIEESGNSAQAIKAAAIESLLATTLVVLLAGFCALVGFALWLTARVRRLQAEADRVIDQHGRIRGNISGTDRRDEIGALAQTLDDTVQRLQHYNGYLEKMAARLSHELRTPLAVVRSSLDNLKQGALGRDEQIYVERAEEGVGRLAGLISRMSEATQLESMLAGSQLERFDLIRLIEGCVGGYRNAYPSRRFDLDLQVESSRQMRGVPDAIAQMLDKLVQNANDFAALGSSIRISLQPGERGFRLAVENEGPAIPEDRLATLFLSMVSSRQGGASQAGHLGLGLYIARIVAEFHQGQIAVQNLPGNRGVRFEVQLPA